MPVKKIAKKAHKALKPAKKIVVPKIPIVAEVKEMPWTGIDETQPFDIPEPRRGLWARIRDWFREVFG